MLRAIRAILTRLRASLEGNRLDKEFGDEVQAHLALLTERFMRQGMSSGEARRAAEHQFGGATRVKEGLHERRGLPQLETFFQDTRYAFRQLRKSPAFTLTAVLTLALGIGANTAIFSVVQAVLLKPLPYKDPSRLVMAWEQNPHRGWYHNIVSAANFLDWRRQNHVFSGMALVKPATFNLTGNSDPVEVGAEQVTANFFAVLGVRPLYGRTFLPEEDLPKSNRVAVLSNGLWHRRYSGDVSLIGRQISLDDQSYTVVGILPPTFSDVYTVGFEVNAQIWISGLDLSDPGRTNHGYIAIARLKPGVTLQHAQSDIDMIARRIDAQYPENTGWGVGLRSMHDDIVGDARPALLVLLAAVGFVLLIACVNLANLLLARGATRMREIALRTALGAGRPRVIRQLLTESCLLSTFGAAVGFALAAWGTRVLVSLAPAATPGIESAGVNSWVLGYTLALAMVTGVLFGLFPALGMSKPDLNESLKESGRGSSEGSSSHRLRGVLVSIEFALALVLVISAGLMIKTFMVMQKVDLGFNPYHVLTMRIPLHGVKYKEPQRQVQFWQQLLARLQALPGVQYASISRGVPIDGWDGEGFVTADNPNPPLGDNPDGNYVVVAPQYFRALGIPLVAGRSFTDSDNAAALPVVIVNQELAREYWPGQNPIGKRIRMGLDAKAAPWLTVVGVARNVRTQGPEGGLHPELYVPYTQYPWSATPQDLVIRTFANPLVMAGAVRRAVSELDKDQPIADIRTLEQIAVEPLELRNFLVLLLGSFAGLALLLAAVGIYGVMSYSVAQRTREIGIRMALGAEKRDVLRIVMRQGAAVGTAGIGAGLLSALAVTRFLSTLLFGVRPTDPSIFFAVSLALLGVAAAATYIPARRAAAVDPLSALRHE